MSRARQGAAGEGAQGGEASAGSMESSLPCGAARRLGESDVQAGTADTEIQALGNAVPVGLVSGTGFWRFSRLKQALFFSTDPFCLFCPLPPRPWLPASVQLRPHLGLRPSQCAYCVRVQSALPGTPALAPAQATSRQAACPGILFMPPTRLASPTLNIPQALSLGLPWHPRCSSKPRRGVRGTQGPSPIKSCPGAFCLPDTGLGLVDCAAGRGSACWSSSVTLAPAAGPVTAASPSTSLCFSHIQYAVTLHPWVPCMGQSLCLGALPAV